MGRLFSAMDPVALGIPRNAGSAGNGFHVANTVWSVSLYRIIATKKRSPAQARRSALTTSLIPFTFAAREIC